MKNLLLVAALAFCGCDGNSPVGPVVGEVVFGSDPSKPMSASSARLNYPEDAVEAKDGSIYISDTHLHVIKRMKDGVIENFAGTFNAGFNGDGNRASVMFNAPTGLLISSDQKYLYLADSGNSIIRRIDIKSGQIQTVAGTAGNAGSLPVIGKPALGGPVGYVAVLKYDPSGNICYQTSQMSKQNTALDGGIYCINKNGITEAANINPGFKLHGIRDFLITNDYTYFIRSKILYKISKDGTLNSTEFPIAHGKGLIEDGRDVIAGVHTQIYRVSEEMQQSSISTGFANVSNIKRYSRGMLIVDSDQGVLYSFDGITKTQLTGAGSDATGALTSIAKYGKGKLLILDNQRPRIFIYDTATGESSVWAGTGELGWASVSVDKLNTKFYYPAAISVDKNLNVYVSEKHRIMKIDNKGNVSLFAGYEKDGDVDSDNPTLARFRSIGGMSFGPDGSLYVSDTYNNKVRKISSSGKVTTLAGTGSVGTPIAGQSSTSVKLNHPLGVLALESGEVLISDSWNNSVIRVDKEGIVHNFAGKQLQSMYQGMGSYSGDNDFAVDSGLNTPAGITTDSRGNVYISDHFNHKIRMISRDGKIITIAGEAQGFAPNGKRLNFPNGMQVIDGYLYVADSGNRMIVRYKIN